MTVSSRRSLFAAALLAGLVPSASGFAADKPKEIRVDWATYNPVSMLLKEKGFLEKEFAKDGIAIRWVRTVSSSNALQFLNAGSIEFGSTAGSAALVAKINGNPIKSVYVYSRPEWTALVTTRDSKISKPEDLKGKKVAMVRGTDPHIFLVRTLLSVGLTDKDITPVLVQQHADGGNLLIRGDIDAWAGLDPMMAEVDHALDHAFARARAAGKLIGVYAGTGERASQFLGKGFDLVAVASDTVMLRSGAQAILKAARS